MPQPVKIWAPDRVEILYRMYRNCCTNAQIAEKLGLDQLQVTNKINNDVKYGKLEKVDRRSNRGNKTPRALREKRKNTWGYGGADVEDEELPIEKLCSYEENGVSVTRYPARWAAGAAPQRSVNSKG